MLQKLCSLIITSVIYTFLDSTVFDSLYMISKEHRKVLIQNHTNLYVHRKMS